MSSFVPKPLEAEAVNGGNRYQAGDGVTPEAINEPIEALLYLQQKAVVNLYIHTITLGTNAYGISTVLQILSTYDKEATSSVDVQMLFRGIKGIPLLARYFDHPYPSTLSTWYGGVPVLYATVGTTTATVTFVSLDTSGQLKVFTDRPFTSAKVAQYNKEDYNG